MGTGTCTGYFGGSLASICSSWSSGCTAGAYSAATSGNIVWVKTGTFSCGAALTIRQLLEINHKFGKPKL